MGEFVAVLKNLLFKSAAVNTVIDKVIVSVYMVLNLYICKVI